MGITITLKNMILTNLLLYKCRYVNFRCMIIGINFLNVPFFISIQELLFGSSKSSSSYANADPDYDLKPSSNSAFQKYVPASNVPSTADINNKLSSSNTSPRRLSWETNNQTNSNSKNGGNSINLGKPGWGESHGRMAAKVAKFCHECGNSFAMPDIRFCCECGVKRLYC